jgi:hypothetical protein
VTSTYEATITIIAADLAEKFPELHHYTDHGGLRGIVSSNTMWATHYGDLNDRAEIVQLRGPLCRTLQEAFLEIVERRRREEPAIEAAVQETGGSEKAAADLAQDLISSLYQSAFEADGASEISRTAGSPFVTSFCTHADEPYERSNGLLSQWRAYGRGEGFCIVFDTAMLGAKLGLEYDAAGYSHLNLGPVHYSFDHTSLRELFPDLVATCERFVDTALDGAPVLGDGIAQLFAAATLFKHQAFHEERELRIVAMPLTARFRELVAAEHPHVALPPQKAILTQERATGPRRYVELFRGQDSLLPIKRVIVGPSDEQASRVEIARAICGHAIEVVPSETPFKG